MSFNTLLDSYSPLNTVFELIGSKVWASVLVHATCVQYQTLYKLLYHRLYCGSWNIQALRDAPIILARFV